METLFRCRFIFAALVLSAAVPLSGQPIVSGTVLDATKHPIADARVELLPVPSNFVAGRLRLEGRNPEPVAAGRSDAAGRFLLQAPSVGVFKVAVHSGGRVPMQESVPLFEDKELPPVVLSPDAGARLRVVDPSGRPLAGAWVFATSSEESARAKAGDDWDFDFRVGRTGADGSLNLSRLAGEKLDVSVFPPGGVEEKRLDVDGGTITIPAWRGELSRLRVVTPEGRPAEGILVRMGDISWPIGLTDAAGRLQIPRRSGEPAMLRLVSPDGHRQGA